MPYRFLGSRECCTTNVGIPAVLHASNASAPPCSVRSAVRSWGHATPPYKPRIMMGYTCLCQATVAREQARCCAYGVGGRWRKPHMSTKPRLML